MKVKTEIVLKAFNVPNFVIVKEIGLIKDEDAIDRSISLNKLSLEVLDEMCNDFRESVLVKAGYPKLTRKA